MIGIAEFFISESGFQSIPHRLNSINAICIISVVFSQSMGSGGLHLCDVDDRFVVLLAELKLIGNMTSLGIAFVVVHHSNTVAGVYNQVLQLVIKSVGGIPPVWDAQLYQQASFVGGLEAAAGAAEGEHKASAVLSCSVLISCVLALVMALAGGLTSLPLPAVALYQVAWAVLAMIFPMIQRY